MLIGKNGHGIGKKDDYFAIGNGAKIQPLEMGRKAPAPYFDGVFVFVTRIVLWCVDDNNELGIKVKIFTLYFKNADNHICDVMVLGMPTKQSNAQHLV